MWILWVCLLKDSIKPNQNDRICHEHCKTHRTFLLKAYWPARANNSLFVLQNRVPIALMFQHDRLQQAQWTGINSNDSSAMCFLLRVCACMCVCTNSPQRHLLQVSGTCCGIKELVVTNNLMHVYIHTQTLACMHLSHRTTPHNYNPRPLNTSTQVLPVFKSQRRHLNSSLLSSFNSALLYWILVTAVLKKRYLGNNESRLNVRLTLVKDKVIGRGKPSCQRLPFSEKETQ